MPALLYDGSQNQTFRSQCSIARALEIVGDKWTLLVVRDLMWHGKHTFKTLQESEEHMPSNTLAERLQRLTSWGLVQRRLYQENPARYEYHLTEEGRSFEPVLLGIMRWGHENLEGGLFDPKNRQASSGQS